MKVDDYIDLFNIDSKCYSKTYDIIEYMLNDFKEERKAIFRYLESRHIKLDSIPMDGIKEDVSNALLTIKEKINL